MRHVLAGLIGLYQIVLSPWLGSNCRFLPTCSQYAKEAVLKHGIRQGVGLAVARIARCHPWSPGGVDAPP